MESTIHLSVVSPNDEVMDIDGHTVILRYSDNCDSSALEQIQTLLYHRDIAPV